MNKTELVDFIAKDAKITKADAAKALNSFTKCVQESLAKDEKVAIIGFGTWSVVEKASRMGRNPRTQEAIEIPAHKAVKFKSSFTL